MSNPRPQKGTPEYEAYRAKCREYARAWRKANPGRVRAHNAKWRAKNPERIREYNRLPHVVLAARVSERERREDVYESYEAHDAYLLRAAAYRRRAGIVKANSPYIPRVGRRIPPTWMRRYCDRYALEAQGVESRAFVREMMNERRKWAHAHNAI